MSELKSVREELGSAIDEAAKRRELAQKIAAENAKEKEPDRTVEEIAKDVEKELKRAAKFANKNEENTLKAFPMLATSPFGAEARKCIFWSEEHDSIGVVCHDEDGVGRYTKVREKYVWDKENKKFLPERIDPTGKNKWFKTWGAPAYPFPLSLFWCVFDFGGKYVICEGEKDALNLNMCGVPTVTLGSTGDAAKWGEHLSKLPKDSTPILFFDNDDAGRKAAKTVKAIFADAGVNALIVKWEILDPKAKNKADATDYIANHGASSLLQKLIKACGFIPKSRPWAVVSAELLSKVRPLKSQNFDYMAEALKRFADKTGDLAYAQFQIEAADLFAKLSAEELAAFNGWDEMSDNERAETKEKIERKYQKQLQMKLVYDFFGRSPMVTFIKHQSSDATKEILELFESNNIAIAKKFSTLHFYNGTHFQSLKPSVLENFFHDWFFAAKINPKQAYSEGDFRRKVKESVIAMAKNLDDDNDDGDEKIEYGYINHQGGIIRIDENGEIEHLEHSPEHKLTYCLRFAYDPDAKCEMWEKFLTSSLVVNNNGVEAPDVSSIALLQEYVGYLFLPRYIQNFIYLYGMGANGKSVFIKVVEALFPKEVVSHIEVVDMDDHMLDGFANKVLNIANEIEAGGYMAKQISLLKSIVEGAPIQINPKHKDTYVNYKPPKQLMSGNDQLKGGGMNDGLIRRMLIVPFDKQIPESKRIDKLDELIIKNELAGVLNWAIAGLKRLVKNGYVFTKSAKVEAAKEEYKLETNQIYAFIKGNFVHGDDGKILREENNRISTAKLYAFYEAWCKAEGVNPLKQKAFSTKLGEHLNTKAQQLTAKERFFVGFRIIEPDNTDITESMNESYLKL